MSRSIHAAFEQEKREPCDEAHAAGSAPDEAAQLVSTGSRCCALSSRLTLGHAPAEQSEKQLDRDGRSAIDREQVLGSRPPTCRVDLPMEVMGDAVHDGPRTSAATLKKTSPGRARRTSEELPAVVSGARWAHPAQIMDD